MSVTREDVMVYSALIAVTCTGVAGLCFDGKMYGLCTALGIIAGGAAFCGMMAYLTQVPSFLMNDDT